LFLSASGLVSRDPKAQKDLLKQIWFNMYSRGGGKIGSSAFEHVFLGELKRGEISGMHNWIFFGTEEAQKKADYLGYIRKLELGGVSLLGGKKIKIQVFENKAVSKMFSPNMD
jgi:poly(U)-specific endoribonuclease